MPHVHVCPLSQLAETVAVSGASHLISIVNEGTPVDRPAAIPEANHLFIGVNDIVEPAEGMTAPETEHVGELIAFIKNWPAARPLVVHCYAGISRSTAGAFIALCAARPDRDEMATARRLREAAPTATPNIRIVALADTLLDRDGRMVRAVQAIGRGELAFEGTPFALPLED
ncbi:tyrosine phosphatase family protein [Bauldia sp.]|uniref:tyrosine phosphatase family protein n=1 Tax=Bauldia sp. TaxID=2575872 RepID=UPI003BAC303F